jgi:hypothetical protein
MFSIACSSSWTKACIRRMPDKQIASQSLAPRHLGGASVIACRLIAVYLFLPACRSGLKGLANRVRSHKVAATCSCGSEPCSRVLWGRDFPKAALLLIEIRHQPSLWSSFPRTAVSLRWYVLDSGPRRPPQRPYVLVLEFSTHRATGPDFEACICSSITRDRCPVGRRLPLLGYLFRPHRALDHRHAREFRADAA